MLRLLAIFFVLSFLFRRPCFHRHPFMGWGIRFPWMGRHHCHHHYGRHGMF